MAESGNFFVNEKARPSKEGRFTGQDRESGRPAKSERYPLGRGIRADVHCHLPKKPETFGAILHRANAAGIDRIVLTAVGPDDFETIDRIGRDRPGQIWTAIGIHPWRVAEWEKRDSSPAALTEDVRQVVCPFLADLSPWKTAIGEIGLDFALRRLDAEGKNRQRKVFERQLEIAAESKRPVILHAVAAEKATRETAVRFPESPLWLFHGFGASEEEIGRLANLEAFFSFSPRDVSLRNPKGRRAVAAAPADRILLESDFPSVGPPESRVEPADLPRLAEEMAVIRQVSAEKMVEQIHDNEEEFFRRWPKIDSDNSSELK